MQQDTHRKKSRQKPIAKDALVKNATDAKQVKNAGIKEKLGRDQEVNDLRWILTTVQGRRFLWRLLEHCKAFNSVMSGSSWTFYNSGQQDVGHFIMSEIMDADKTGFLEMLRENDFTDKGDIDAN